MNDWAVLGVSFVYVLLVVGAAEGLRRARLVSFDLSRKIIHIGIGTWILPTVLLFHSRWLAALPPAVFVLLNLLSLRFRWTRAMDADAGSNIGTVLFPLSFVILLLGFWGAPGGRAATCSGLLALAWGDAAAALIGLRWGRHRYRAGSGWRSLEGSAAMLVFSLLAIFVSGLAVGPHPYAPLLILGGALVASLLEATGRRGADNLLVPLGTALFLWGIGRLLPIG